jgi:hypothetical protein
MLFAEPVTTQAFPFKSTLICFFPPC